MHQKPTSTDTAKKLPIDQDAWLLFNFDKLEVIRLHLAPGESMENHINEWRIIFFVLRGAGDEQSIVVEGGKERFWTNREDRTLELLVIKTRDET